MKERAAILALVAASLILGACAPGQEEKAPMVPAQEAVHDLVVQWDNALRSGDVDGAVGLYVEDSPAIMPPDTPAETGADGLRAQFTSMFETGGLQVTNRAFGVLEGGGLVAAQGAYTLSIPEGDDEYLDETGKWICISRRKDDGSLAVVRNIWNRDAPPPGAAPVPGYGDSGPAAAEDAPCLETPSEIDDSFVVNWVEGNVPVLVANHTEEGSRMPPGQPSVDGRDRIAAFLQSEIDMSADRELEILERGEEIGGDLGYTWGNFHVAYDLADGSGSVDHIGKYVAVSQRGEDGCWRYVWVLWNGDAPWPGTE